MRATWNEIFGCHGIRAALGNRAVVVCLIRGEQRPREVFTLRGGQSPRGALQSPRGTVKVPEGPFKVPEGWSKSPRGPSKSPRVSIKVPKGPFKVPEGQRCKTFDSTRPMFLFKILIGFQSITSDPSNVNCNMQRQQRWRSSTFPSLVPSMRRRDFFRQLYGCFRSGHLRPRDPRLCSVHPPQLQQKAHWYHRQRQQRLRRIQDALHPAK